MSDARWREELKAATGGAAWILRAGQFRLSTTGGDVWIWETGGHRWQCTIGRSTSTVEGHGRTPVEALHDATATLRRMLAIAEGSDE